MNFPKEPLKPFQPSLRQSDLRTSSFAAAQMGAVAGSTLPGDRRGAQPWGQGGCGPPMGHVKQVRAKLMSTQLNGNVPSQPSEV